MSQRILIVNKFMYPRGGDCVVAINTARLLRDRGYDVGLWAMDYPDNIASTLSGLYASRVDFNGSAIGKVRAAMRTLGYDSIRKQFRTVLNQFRPDTVHFHNIHSYLSPAIVEEAHSFGARTLWTLHDYKLSCPAYVCSRNGTPCTECLTDTAAVLRHRCMKQSFAASLIGYLEANRWPVSRLVRSTDIFICPSDFMRDMAIRSGVPASKVTVIPNFIAPDKLEYLTTASTDQRVDQYAYYGRLSAEKGCRLLLEVASHLPHTLHIYGSGPLEKELIRDYRQHNNIIFHGHADAQTVARSMRRMRFTIVPSQWHENNPLSVIESLCSGTPVAGAATGGIPELIKDGHNGLLFDPFSRYELEHTINAMFACTDFDNQHIAREALARFSATNHLISLIQLL